MISRWHAMLCGGSIALLLSTGAFAQQPPQLHASPAPPPAGPSPRHDPQQLKRGKVQQFTLTPTGDIDGLILIDGTEVKTPPHLSTQIAYAIKPGDTVTIHGLRTAALPLVQATSITSEATGFTITDNESPGAGRDPAAPPPPAGPTAGTGGPIHGMAVLQRRVQMALHGPRGDLNGALLDDGAILRLPPMEARRFEALLRPGQMIVVAGTEHVTPLGTVIDARQIGASRDQLNLIERGPRHGHLLPPPVVTLAPPSLHQP